MYNSKLEISQQPATATFFFKLKESTQLTAIKNNFNQTKGTIKITTLSKIKTRNRAKENQYLLKDQILASGSRSPPLP